ncbi:MAG TPA: BON domain-containing protein [Rhizobiaceae bacterium]|nr:BON domain-containing protein [Rhizobiaceae bacterium]
MAQDRNTRYGRDFTDYEDDPVRSRGPFGSDYRRRMPERWRGQGGGYAAGSRNRDYWSDIGYEDQDYGDGWFGGFGEGNYYGRNQGGLYGSGPVGEGRYGVNRYGYFPDSSGGRYGESSRPYGGHGRGYAQGGRDFWDRAGDEVSSWFGDEDAARRRRQDQHRGRGPKNYTRSDERIEEDINDRLTDDWMLDATEIEVEVSGGDVTLSGNVDERSDKRRAEDIAESVSGVGNVQNNIRVKQRNWGSGGLGENTSTT